MRGTRPLSVVPRPPSAIALTRRWFLPTSPTPPPGSPTESAHCGVRPSTVFASPEQAADPIDNVSRHTNAFTSTVCASLYEAYGYPVAAPEKVRRFVADWEPRARAAVEALRSYPAQVNWGALKTLASLGPVASAIVLALV